MKTETETETETETKNEKEIIIVRVEGARISFCHIFKPQAPKGGGKLKYSCDLILDKKKDAAIITKLEKLGERAMLDKWGKKVKIKHHFLHDGSEKEEYDGYGDDVMYVTAKNDSRPAVVDGKKNPLTEEDGKIYGGCFVNASLEIYGFHHDVGGDCILASLRVIQFLKDGPSFGARGANVDDEMDEVTDDVNDY